MLIAAADRRVEELELVRRYLSIEQVRFPDRLRPEVTVPGELLRAAVPDLVLQPLVENALRHGLARRVEATLLRIEARREDDDLVLTVTDDGPGPDTGPRPEGVGLANTRERLALLYGDRGRVELTRSAAGGAAATVRLPYRELPAAEGDER